jgi:hypothetical protein
MRLSTIEAILCIIATICVLFLFALSELNPFDAPYPNEHTGICEQSYNRFSARVIDVEPRTNSYYITIQYPLRILTFDPADEGSEVIIEGRWQGFGASSMFVAESIKLV